MAKKARPVKPKAKAVQPLKVVAKSKAKTQPIAKRLTRSQLRTQALDYHRNPRPGKIEIVPTKPVRNSMDLSLAYSPGVAEPCLEIQKDPQNAYCYTNKGNLVGIISNGSAVLGLGNIGPLASKPVMEGKAMLFKIFAGVDVFDIEISCSRSEQFIGTVLSIADTFGAINLEDIAAPDCFQIEERLREELDIPVLHDDQSGTAVVACAALRNAMEIQQKNPYDVKVVCVGAGAAGIGIMRLGREYFGWAPEQLYLVDSKGLVTVDRANIPAYKWPYAKTSTSRTKQIDAMRGADIVIGVSVRDNLTPQMIAAMAVRPIILAMANPDPEILPEQVHAVRDDAIVATGRSDYPNQVNNSVCFPYLFRGALDAHAKKFTPAMFDAAIRAIADLAREPVTTEVKKTFPREADAMVFGRQYILPKQNDKRLLERIAPAVRDAYSIADVK